MANTMEDSNRRRHPRRSVRIDGAIFLPDEKREIRVLVVNLSREGASVEVETNLGPETRVVLSAGEFGRFEGKIRWKRGRRLGIRFDDAGLRSDDNEGDLPRNPFVRSRDSFAFEQVWRSLPCEGLIPQRRAFEPRLAKALLRHVILVQAPSLGDQTLRVRLAGDGIRQIAGNIVGHNFLDFMQEEERKARALNLIREMFERPCGLWQVSPVHYERGFSHYWELTAFPLAACERGPATVLGLVRPFEGLLLPHGGERRAVRFDAAVKFEAIALDS